MKPDYLARKVTINHHGFTTLCAELTKDLVLSADGPGAAVYALSIGLLQSQLCSKLDLTDEPKTFSAAEFSGIVFDHLRESYYAGVELDRHAHLGLEDANIMHLGLDAMMATRIAEKLFGKDEDFEAPPSAKDGDDA